jgi:protein-S-isoprenylcysteine O-methyltransferase Ste14
LQSSPTTPGVPAPPRVNAPILLVAGLVAGVVLDFLLPYWPSLPGLVRLAGAFPLAVGLALGLPAVRAMLRAKTSPVPTRKPTALVTTGIYAHTRNPMYVGMLAMYGGLALLLSSVWALILIAPLIAGVDLIIVRNEEAIMRGLFGARYSDYVSRVPRWL